MCVCWRGVVVSIPGCCFQAAAGVKISCSSREAFSAQLESSVRLTLAPWALASQSVSTRECWHETGNLQTAGRFYRRSVLSDCLIGLEIRAGLKSAPSISNWVSGTITSRQEVRRSNLNSDPPRTPSSPTMSRTLSLEFCPRAAEGRWKITGTKPILFLQKTHSLD